MKKCYVYIYNRRDLHTQITRFIVKLDLFSGEVKEVRSFAHFAEAQQYVLCQHPQHVRVNPDSMPDFCNRMPDLESHTNWEGALVAVYVPSDSRHTHSESSF